MCWNGFLPAEKSQLHVSLLSFMLGDIRLVACKRPWKEDLLQGNQSTKSNDAFQPGQAEYCWRPSGQPHFHSENWSLVFIAVPGLSPVATTRSCSLVVMCRLLAVVASLVAGDGFQGTGA